MPLPFRPALKQPSQPTLEPGAKPTWANCGNRSWPAWNCPLPACCSPSRPNWCGSMSGGRWSPWRATGWPWCKAGCPCWKRPWPRPWVVPASWYWKVAARCHPSRPKPRCQLQPAWPELPLPHSQPQPLHPQSRFQLQLQLKHLHQHPSLARGLPAQLPVRPPNGRPPTRCKLRPEMGVHHRWPPPSMRKPSGWQIFSTAK